MAPVWNKQFEIYVPNVNDKISFWVGEEDVMWDDDVGTAELTVKDIIGEGLNGKDDWYDIKYKGEPSGKIQLTTELTPISQQGAN